MLIDKVYLFFAGIHGVGKTTLCSEICAGTRWKYISASSQIQGYSSTSLNEKSVKDIDQNQIILLEALNQLSPGHYILDGHFCLIDKSTMKPIPIPLKIFQQINPKSIFLIIDDVRSIQKKLSKRGEIYELSFLENMQKEKIKSALIVSSEIKANLYIVDLKLNNEGFTAIIKTLLA